MRLLYARAGAGVEVLLEMGLILRCRDGDPAAFAQLVEATQGRTHALAWRLAGNPHDTMDLVQEGYVAVWRALPGLRHPEAFTAWFLRVFANACHDWLRRSRRAPVPLEEPKDPWGVAAPALPDEATVQRETQGAVQRLVRNLPPIYAVTISLHYTEELGYRELADVLGVPVRTVETRLRRAREMLRRQAEAQELGGDGHERAHMPAGAKAATRLPGW